MRIVQIFFLLAFSSLSFADSIPIPAAPEFDVHSYVLMDFNSGKVLAEKDADRPVDPASITKLMTAYMVYKALQNGDMEQDEKILVSEKAWREGGAASGGSTMFLKVNSEVPVRELLLGVIIQSGNDASIALAERLGGTEEAFADMMNHEAQKMGLTGSHFMNATGLPDEQHYMTARDIATLAAAIIREFPDEYVHYSQKKFTYNGIEQYNRNKLLWQDSAVDGLKTGHTNSAGYCLAASAKKDDMRLISVILGSGSNRSRTEQTRALLNYGFRYYESHRLYAAGQSLTTKRVWFGEQKEVPLGVGSDVYVLIPRGRYEDLQAFMDVDKRLEAPLQSHQQVGSVRITLDGKDYQHSPLVALEPVPEGSITRKISDFVMGYFE